MKFHRQKGRSVSSRTCQKDSANSIEIACVSRTKSVIFQVVVCYCHLGAESRRVATVGSTRENRKPRVELTFNRAGLACYEGKMSRIASVATLAGERAKKKEIRERLEGGGSVAWLRPALAVMKQRRPPVERTDLAAGQLNESRMSTRCVSCNSHPIVHSLATTAATETWL